MKSGEGGGERGGERPGLPVDSILLARVTSLEKMSNLNFLVPTMPQLTDPECTPTRMSTCSLLSWSNSSMALIMAKPMSTQHLAWSGRGSGQPLTQ